MQCLYQLDPQQYITVCLAIAYLEGIKIIYVRLTDVFDRYAPKVVSENNGKINSNIVLVC